MGNGQYQISSSEKGGKRSNLCFHGSYAAEAVTVHQGRNGPSDMHEPYIEYLSMFSQERKKKHETSIFFPSGSFAQREHAYASDSRTADGDAEHCRVFCCSGGSCGSSYECYTCSQKQPVCVHLSMCDHLGDHCQRPLVCLHELLEGWDACRWKRAGCSFLPETGPDGDR